MAFSALTKRRAWGAGWGGRLCCGGMGPGGAGAAPRAPPAPPSAHAGRGAPPPPPTRERTASRSDIGASGLARAALAGGAASSLRRLLSLDIGGGAGEASCPGPGAPGGLRHPCAARPGPGERSLGAGVGGLAAAGAGGAAVGAGARAGSLTGAGSASDELAPLGGRSAPCVPRHLGPKRTSGLFLLAVFTRRRHSLIHPPAPDRSPPCPCGQGWCGQAAVLHPPGQR